MNFFSEATLRLKQQLGVAQDRDIAALLDLSPTSWAGRKKRGNFPETELYALVAKRPDLKLDVNYVLTGITAEAQASLAAKERRIAAAVDAGASIDQVRAMEQHTDPASVDAIVALLRGCRVNEREAVHTLLKSIIALREALAEAQAQQ